MKTNIHGEKVGIIRKGVSMVKEVQDQLNEICQRSSVVEQGFCKPQVVGSSPIAGSNGGRSSSGRAYPLHG